MKNPNVYELIKSLNMSEKRQFKIYSSRHVIKGENKYTLIFDILDEMEKYHPDELNTKLSLFGKNIKYIKADMNFLYQLLLKSLVLFHSRKSAQIILNESISIIEILYYKGNYEQCLKEIHKATIIAKSVELYPTLYKILQYELLVNQYLNQPVKSAQKTITELNTINTIQQNITEYYRLYYEANSLRINIVKTRNKKEIVLFGKFIKNKLLQDEKYATSLSAKIKFHQIVAMWYFVNNDKKNELNSNNKIIQLFESNLLYKNENLVEYVNTYSRILSITKDIDEQLFYNQLQKVRKINVLPEKLYYLRVTALIFNFSYMIELSMYLRNKKIKKAASIIKDIENGLEKFKVILTPSHKITFLYMLSYYYFIIGRFDEAQKNINITLNIYNEKDRPDVYNFAKLLNILIHFEQANFSYIKYKQASVNKYFKKQASAYETERIILKFFSKEKNFTINLDNSLLKLKEELMQSKSHSLEKYAYNYFDWIEWVNSKIAKKKSMYNLNQ